MPNLILKLQCQDQVGVVAKVSSLIAQWNGWILSAGQYGDTGNQQFFMRVEIKENSLSCSLTDFKHALSNLAVQLNMTWSLVDLNQKKRGLIFTGLQLHCLSDLLYRHQCGDLDFNLLGIISNHPDGKKLAEAYNINYHHIPFNENNPADFYDQVKTLLNRETPDLIILARFMRILPESICQQYKGKIINIHHGFLPSFVGADSYEKALEKGVKMIGATCHYVTPTLDQGPIIEQDVIRINHVLSLNEIKQLGSDIEKSVLARGVRYHLEERICINNEKTIIFQ